MTENELQQLGIHEAWLEPLNDTFERFEINTPLRQACFIGQCAHESEHFKFLEENLNYKAESLMRVWPSHFNHELAQECAHNHSELLTLPTPIAWVTVVLRQVMGLTTVGAV